MTDTLYPYAYSGATVPWATIEAAKTWQLLHPEMQRRSKAMILAGNGRVGVGQGWRDPAAADVEFRHRHHVVPCSTPGAIQYLGQCWVLSAGFEPLAPPDRSYHCPTELWMNGAKLVAACAIDFVGDLAWMDSVSANYGLFNFSTLVGDTEKWHAQPAEIPHARGTLNVNPPAFPLHTFTLPGTIPPQVEQPPTQPPTQEDTDMAITIQCDPNVAPGPPAGDLGAVFTVTGIIAAWVNDPGDLATARRHGVAPTADPVLWPRADFKALRLVGAVPPGWSDQPGVDFREVIG